MKKSNLLNKTVTRGGGPTTAVGKSNSSRNATKHGMYSPSVVLPSESEFEFNALKQEFIDEHSPRDTVQLMLVHDLAVLVWKKQRLESLESRMIGSRIADPISSEELQDELMFYFPKDREWILDLLSALTEEFAQTHQHRSDYARKMIGLFRILRAGDLELMKIECPSLDEFIQNRADYRMLSPHMRTPEGLINTMFSLTGNSKDDQSFLLMELYGAVDESKQILWGYEHLAEIQRGIEKIRDKRHMQMNYRSNTHRLYGELGKSIARTCSELSKHQQIYQGLISQGFIHPIEQIATTVGGKGSSTLLQKGDSNELPNSQQVSSSVQGREAEREAEREAGQLKNLIKLNENCERALHLESLRNRRLFKMPQFTKRTRSH